MIKISSHDGGCGDNVMDSKATGQDLLIGHETQMLTTMFCSRKRDGKV